MGTRKRWLTLPLLAGILLTLPACGTRVALSERTAINAGSGSDLDSLSGAPTASPITDAGTSSDLPSSAATPTDMPVAPSAPAASSSPPDQTSASAPVINKTPVKIGISITLNSAAAYHSAGFDIDRGDERSQAQTVINEINAHGGLGGRPIAPVWDMQDANDGTTVTDKEAKSCARFTQDNHVMAVAGSHTMTINTLLPCLNKAGVAYMANGGGNFYDQKILDDYPLVLSPGMLNPTRVYPALVERLKAKGYFAKWGALPAVKVGIVAFDHPEEHRVIDKVLKPALSAAGFPSVAEVYSAEDITAVATQMQAAVLKFKRSGVSHVFIVDQGGGVATFMMIAAETQGFHPRYAMSTFSAPGALLEGLAAPAQLRGSMGFGWNPLADVSNANDQVSNKNPQWVKCKALMVKAGVDMSNRVAAYGAGQFCDTLFVLTHIATPLSGYTGRGIIEQSKTLGSAFQSAITTTGTFISAARRDGVSAARDIVYDGGCQCFKYVSNPFKVR